MKKILAPLSLFLTISILFFSAASAFKIDIDIKTDGNNQTNQTSNTTDDGNKPNIDLPGKLKGFLKKVLDFVLNTFLKGLSEEAGSKP